MKTNREKLLERLSLLKPALKLGGLIPELAHVWFRDGRALAYDGSSLGVRVEVELSLECGLPGAVLIGMLATSRIADVTLEPDDSFVLLKMGRSRTKLAALDPSRDVWPFPAAAPAPREIIVITEDLLRALARVLVVESNGVRVEHRGVLVYRDKKTLTLCTTDSATIASVVVGIKNSGGDAFMLPRAFAEQVAKNCHAGDELRVHDDHLVAAAQGVSMFSQVIDTSAALDIRDVMRRTAKGHPDPVPIPAGVARALERATILEGKSDAVVDLSFVGGDVALRGSYKYGYLDEHAKIKGDHPDASGLFTAGLVARGLGGATTMSLDEGALLLHGEGDDDLYAVAPRSQE